MKIEITYPCVSKRKKRKKVTLAILKALCLIAAIASVTVNICVGGKAWSAIVIVSLYTLWTLLLSPDLVEYNRISQFIKLILCACILLWIIDVFLAPGWAIVVVPIVCFGGLIVSEILFFTDIQRQKQNMGAILLLIIISVIGSAVGLSVYNGKNTWALWAMGSVALLSLIVFAVVLGRDFVRELKRRFHTN